MSRNWIKPTLLTTFPNGAPRLNWAFLYKQRQRLEDNWRKGRFKAFQLPHPSHPYEAHRECVYAIQFSGKWLVSGSRDRTIRVWNLETRRLRGSPLAGHLKSVLCLQFDPSEDEDIIVSGSSDRNVIIWRFSTGQKIHELNNAHQDSVLNLRFDKRYLVTCSKDKLIKVWSRKELRPTDPNYPAMYRGAGVRYPSYIVDTSAVGSLSLEAQLANQQIKAVNAIQIGNDEIVSASGDRLIKVWDIHNGRCMRTLMGHSKGIACVQIDKRRIVSGSNDDTVRIYDHASGAEVACLQGHQDLVRTVQAGFGDLPDADETLRQEAREVDNRYWEAQRRASLENDDDEDEDDAENAAASQDAGANRQTEIRAVGAQIPPGGGGSKWARIVSGSYDETIIIWRRDQEGKWVPAQRLRQEDAARAASATAIPQAAGSSSRNPDQAQAALAAQISATISPPHSNNQTIGTHYGSQISTATATAPPATAPNLIPAILPQAAGTQLPLVAVAPPPTQPLNIPQAPIPANPAPTAQAAPNPQTGPAVPAAPAHFPYRGPHTNHPIARVFKLQFDARKLICASQDSRIVGWDFACSDKEIEQACQFFTGF
jgi:F-box and WD-40 domain protein 1/11